MSQDVLLIDNVDSFTHNVADLIRRVLGREPVIWRHDHPATRTDLEGFAAIVVGPGPGRPQVSTDMGVSEIALAQRSVPVLGVCLGHQGLAHLAGENVVELDPPRHGVVSPVEHDGTGLFAGLPNPLQVVRYHSLHVETPLRSRLEVTATAADDGAVMALADPSGPRFGVQFHPESVLSEHGERLLGNFFALAGVEVARTVRLRARRLGEGVVDPWELHRELFGAAPQAVWLDASDGSGWSVMADDAGPLAHTLEHRVGHPDGPFLDRLDVDRARWRLEDPQEARDLPFAWRPGHVGYLGYELKAETGGRAGHRSPWPDAWMLFVDRGVVLEHATGAAWAVWIEDPADEEVVTAQARWADEVGRVVTRLRDDPAGAVSRAVPQEVPSPSPLRPREDPAAYRALVERCQEEIRRGESYEICLTTTWSASGTGVDEGELYRAMREVSPVPHGAWLRTPALSVLGCSPERFVSVSADGVVEARPIKGTRPRGTDEAEDRALAHELATAVKDRAENLMIVDLLRHDLHRVCAPGSVHVPEIFAVESYATVHQLVSTVRGRLLPGGAGATDVLRSCFPGGSMTGAPKVRTMEIIDELESGPRGVYSGAVGWIGLDGAMDTSIVIRTATWTPGGDVTVGAGGAVTALSDPAEEEAEMRTKVRAVETALGRALIRTSAPCGP